jgi:hypothetical protein
MSFPYSVLSVARANEEAEQARAIRYAASRNLGLNGHPALAINRQVVHVRDCIRAVAEGRVGAGCGRHFAAVLYAIAGRRYRSAIAGSEAGKADIQSRAVAKRRVIEVGKRRDHARSAGGERHKVDGRAGIAVAVLNEIEMSRAKPSAFKAMVLKLGGRIRHFGRLLVGDTHVCISNLPDPGGSIFLPCSDFLIGRVDRLGDFAGIGDQKIYTRTYFHNILILIVKIRIFATLAVMFNTSKGVQNMNAIESTKPARWGAWHVGVERTDNPWLSWVWHRAPLLGIFVVGVGKLALVVNWPVTFG